MAVLPFTVFVANRAGSRNEKVMQVCYSLSDEPSHESRNASTSKTSLYHKHKPVIVASNMLAGARCSQKSGGASKLHARVFPAVVASSALLRARRWRPTRSVGDEGRVACMLCNMAQRSQPVLQ